MDSNLTWKYHIDYVASKISKIVGITARLRQYMSHYGLVAWGQVARSHLTKSLCCKNVPLV